MTARLTANKRRTKMDTKPTAAWVWFIILMSGLLLFLNFNPVLADGSTVTYTYDEAGRLIGADYGDGWGVAYTYDAAGNLLSRTIELEKNIYLPLVLR
jgi:YD repeat-containing protein